ncbi:hypothetical protein LX64_01674 [Chitinophaga skermanii]|uniref:Uncharacterized protein n=1 Tax=Chitinophaga skermanii TaxID=331697 RepID=A0A327QY15_9BACT|nr:hypothetical protein [Chitinophaga skermanii]RAJ06547.1 hypothetical protein LX64_01674 [Chitinophaga skermanii]
MRLRPLLYCLLALATFSACKKSNKKQDEDFSKNTYEVKSVKFIVNASSNYYEMQLLERRFTYLNNTSLQQGGTVEVSPQLERSYFNYELEEMDTIVNTQQLFIQVPTYYDENGSFTYSKLTWAFVPKTLTTQPAIFTVNEKYIVPSMSKLTMEVNVTHRQINLPFEATLKHTRTGVTKTITGTWQGTFPVDVKTKSTTENL